MTYFPTISLLDNLIKVKPFLFTFLCLQTNAAMVTHFMANITKYTLKPDFD